MPNELDPVVDQWYMHRDKGEMFRVVAVDGAAGVVEIQNFGGDVEELELEAWRDLDIDLAEPPEDWSGPFDDIDPGDLDCSETALHKQDWRVSLEALRAPEDQWQDTRVLDDIEKFQELRGAELYLEEDD